MLMLVVYVRRAGVLVREWNLLSSSEDGGGEQIGDPVSPKTVWAVIYHSTCQWNRREDAVQEQISLWANLMIKNEKRQQTTRRRIAWHLFPLFLYHKASAPVSLFPLLTSAEQDSVCCIKKIAWANKQEVLIDIRSGMTGEHQSALHVQAMNENSCENESEWKERKGETFITDQSAALFMEVVLMCVLVVVRLIRVAGTSDARRLDSSSNNKEHRASPAAQHLSVSLFCSDDIQRDVQQLLFLFPGTDSPPDFIALFPSLLPFDSLPFSPGLQKGLGYFLFSLLCRLLLLLLVVAVKTLINNRREIAPTYRCKRCTNQKRHRKGHVLPFLSIRTARKGGTWKSSTEFTCTFTSKAGKESGCFSSPSFSFAVFQTVFLSRVLCYQPNVSLSPWLTHSLTHTSKSRLREREEESWIIFEPSAVSPAT